MRFLSKFNDVLIYVLLGAGFIKLMLDLWADVSITFGVVRQYRKAILFMLPTNVAQLLVAILLGFTLPITAPQVLGVNMVTSVALALVISFEPRAGLL